MPDSVAADASLRSIRDQQPQLRPFLIVTRVAPVCSRRRIAVAALFDQILRGNSG
jgi:hypothetical protein